MKNLIDKAKNTHELSRDEIILILKEDSINEYLFSAADDVRKKYIGDEVYLRALIEFSNICRCNCAYCGIRRDNENVKRFRLTKDEILSLANYAIQAGYKTLVLQSGEDAYFSAGYLAEIISEIKKSGIAVTLSIGERSFDEYKILKDAGADRFLLRIETTNPVIYEKMHPNMTLENRKRCLFDLKKLGYETGTGSLIGLPEQSVEDLADDILFFKACFHIIAEAAAFASKGLLDDGAGAKSVTGVAGIGSFRCLLQRQILHCFILPAFFINLFNKITVA